MILTQTAALLVDAYRELNARKLFWVTIGLNLVVIVVFASLGINEDGVTFWHWSFDSPAMNTRFVSPELFYKTQFVTWGIPVWLSWIATILALISTASIVPDLVAGGSIETMISKPISRVRLFLTKYTTGLLFAALQVLVFAVGCFLVIAIRGGSLEFRLFLAVPIVVVFFSYLFAVCALVGLLTRSSIAALLLTLVFWFVMFAANATDEMLIVQREVVTVHRDELTEQLANEQVLADRMIEQMLESDQVFEDNQGNPITDHDDRRRAVNPKIALIERRIVKAEQSVEDWTGWTDLVERFRFPMPKTAETINLLTRYLLTMEDLASVMSNDTGIEITADEEPTGMSMADPRIAERTEEALRERSVVWIVGTSLGFEAVVLGVCCIVFARRDF